MFFKFLVLLGKITNWPGLPICRVFNEARTESYTLRRDGWVLIQGLNSKSTDMLPIMMVSQKLVDKFEEELKHSNIKQ